MNKVSLDNVEFALLTEQPAATIDHIRALRNSDAVRAHMYHDHLISETEHLAWIARLRHADCERVMVVIVHGKVAGLVALNAIDWRHKRADWAFYLSHDAQGKGIGGVVECKLLDLAFFDLGLEKLNCEVLASNPKVIALHRKFGFTLEGTRRAHVIKDGVRVDVALLGMQAAEWRALRPRFVRLFSAKQNDTPTR